MSEKEKTVRAEAQRIELCCKGGHTFDKHGRDQTQESFHILPKARAKGEEELV
jgi:hypothetical protein